MRKRLDTHLDPSQCGSYEKTALQETIPTSFKLLEPFQTYDLSMSSLSRKLIFVFLILGISLAPNSASAKSSVTRYSNCKQLQKVWRNGVAKSSSVAKKQAVKPKVNAAVYAENRRLDTDRDGTACEVKAPKTTTPSVSASPIVSVNTSVAPSTVTTVAKYVCPTGTWKFELTGFRVTFSTPTLNSAFRSYYFETMGTFTNSTNAILFPNLMQAKVAFTPNTDNWLRAYPTSPATFNVFINSSFEVAPGAEVLVSGSGVLESSNEPSLAGQSIQVMWNDPRNVAWCPAPVKG